MIVKRVCLLTFVGGCVGEGLVNWDGRNCNTLCNLYLSLQPDERVPAAARPALFLSTQTADKQGNPSRRAERSCTTSSGPRISNITTSWELCRKLITNESDHWDVVFI